MCGGTGSRSDWYMISTVKAYERRISNLCLTIVGYWHKSPPQREPANEGVARVELSIDSETGPTSCMRNDTKNNTRSARAGHFVVSFEQYKVDRVKSLQNQAMHKTVDDRSHMDIFVCLVHGSKVTTEPICSRMQIGHASGPKVSDYKMSAPYRTPYQVPDNFH